MGKRSFSREYKVEAVRMLESQHRPASEIARELGISPNLLYKWKREFRDSPEEAFPGKGRLTEAEEQLRRLRRELEDARQENSFLKKTAAYFASQRDRGSR